MTKKASFWSKFSKRRFHSIPVVILATASSFLTANAVPAFPGIQTVSQPDGTTMELRLIGDEFGHVTVNADGHVMRQDSDGWWREDNSRTISSELSARRSRLNRRKTAPSGAITSFPREGEVRSLIVLVDFPDVNFVTPEVKNEFSQMLNLPGFDRREHIGSAADYFRIQSSGKFSPSFDVYGPVRADRPSTYYGENDANGDDMRAHELVIEVCRKLDNEIDFTEYDLDGDGMVDNIYLFYAGYGENFAGNKSSWIWPHANHIETLGIPASERTFDGKQINSYGCCAELYGSTGADTASIGTFCHEFGHILGLPDTYDVNYSEDGSGNHPDQWDIMASGSYLPATRNCGAVPAAYTAVERWLLGWSEPVEISKSQKVKLEPLTLNGMSVRISTEDPDEFFLLENRQQISGTYDRFIPSHGLLIWHVDRRKDAVVNVTIGGQHYSIPCADAWNLEYNAVNSNAQHQCLEIEKASGNDGSKSSLDTPFPGRQLKTEFTDYTTPSMVSWGGKPTGKPVTDIKETGGIITFDYMGGSDRQVIIESLEAKDVTASSFTACWSEHPDAEDGYKVTIYSVFRSRQEDVVTIDETLNEIPDGWTAVGAENREGNLVLGTSAAGILTTSETDLREGGSLTIRARQAGASAGSITIKLGDRTVTSYLPTDAMSNYTVELPACIEPTAITLQSERRKPVALESLTLCQDLDVVDFIKLNDKCGTYPSGASNHKVEELEKDHEYAYSVEARGYVGSSSPLVFVRTNITSGVENPDDVTDGSFSEIYGIDGTRVSRIGSPGIYVVKTGESFRKIIVR